MASSSGFVPSLYSPSTSTCRKSFGSIGAPVFFRRPWMIGVKISESFLRAASRRRCAGVGSQEAKKLRCEMPCSRST